MSSEFDRPEDRGTVEALERVLPRVAPPDDLFDRVLGEIRGEPTVVPLRPRRHRRRGAIAAIAAVAAAAVVALAVVIGNDDPASPASRAALTGKSVPSVTGEARLYDPDADGGRVSIELRNVPPPPAGHHYEIWVLREGTDEMEAVGSFTPTSGDVELDLPLPGAGDFVAVDISVEENAGPPAHSGTSLAGGAFV